METTVYGKLDLSVKDEEEVRSTYKEYLPTIAMHLRF